MKYLAGTLGCIFAIISLSAQEQSVNYRAEMFGSVASGDNTPFWMLYHNWGMTPLKATNGYVRAGVFYSRTLNRDWSLNAGLDVAVSSAHAYNTCWVQQIYGQVNWKIFQLYAGSKEDYTSLLDKQLSSGDFVAANNARPIPKIQISIPEFVLVPYTKGNFYIKGHFSVGKFMDGNLIESKALPLNRPYIYNQLEHGKAIYFRFGNIDKNSRQFTFGVNHQAQWGGVIHRYVMKNNNGTYEPGYDIVKQPSTISDFLRTFVAKEGGSEASLTDKQFVAGSHIGAYLFRYDHKLNNGRQLSAYIHHFFEDGSGMVFENYPDNLYGIQYKSGGKHLLSNAVLEFIYTKQQSGAIHYNAIKDEAHSHLKGNGNDNYYNNVDYIQGPSYFGRTMGTPLFLSPEYNTDGHVNFKGSRIIAFHAGFEGFFTPDLSYRLLATTGQNWGRFYVPFTSIHDGVATNLDIMYNCPKMNGWEFKLSTGYNAGAFFGSDTFGAGITVTKRGTVFSK
ncbi:MAG: capsule assembly Wzi family protein [Bacteroidales bacterium]|jgi:hypothetical protein|nr:capsule assembly Wzi family protein [Bacteroidales bacterium]